MENAGQPLLVRLRIYISSYWNRLDCTCLLFVLVGGPLSNTVPSEEDLMANKTADQELNSVETTAAIFHETGRVLLIIALLLYFVRLLYVFCIHKIFGPKIVMVGRMVQRCIL